MRTAGRRILCYVAELRPELPPDLDLAAAWGVFQKRGRSRSLRLDADLVEYTTQAARCDPLGIVPPSVLATLSDLNRLFPSPPPGLERFSSFTAGPRVEYLKLTARLLEVGKLGLAFDVRGGGAVFPVAKSD